MKCHPWKVVKIDPKKAWTHYMAGSTWEEVREVINSHGFYIAAMVWQKGTKCFGHLWAKGGPSYNGGYCVLTRASGATIADVKRKLDKVILKSFR